jgi:hypothetical protein
MILMKKSPLPSLSLFLPVLILSVWSCKYSGHKEETFLGKWYSVKGKIDVYSFMKDNKSFICTGTLGQVSVLYGTWRIDRDKFVITMDNGTVTSYSYSLANDTLVFNSGEEIYTKTVPLEVQYPEVKILKDLASDFSSHKFSKPLPADLRWGLWVDSTHSSKELLLKGYAISMGSGLVSDDIANLSGYLSDHGFTKDTVFVSGICNGFWDDNQLVTICTGQDTRATDDSVNILVSSAFIKQ